MGNCFSDCGDDSEIIAQPRDRTQNARPPSNHYQYSYGHSDPTVWSQPPGQVHTRQPAPVKSPTPPVVVKEDVCVAEYIAALERHLQPYGVGLFIPEDQFSKHHKSALREAMCLTEGASAANKKSVETAINQCALYLQQIKSETQSVIQRAELELTRKIGSGQDLQRFISDVQRELEENVKRLPERLRPGTLKFVQSKVSTLNAIARYTQSYRDFFLQPLLDLPLEDAKVLAERTAEEESRLIVGYLPPALQQFLSSYKTGIWNNYQTNSRTRLAEEEALVQKSLAVAMATYKRSMDAATNQVGRSLPALKEIHLAIQASILSNCTWHLREKSTYLSLWNDAKPKLALEMKKEFREYKDTNNLNAMKSRKRAMTALKQAMQTFQHELYNPANITSMAQGPVWDSRVQDAREKAVQELLNEAIKDPAPHARVIGFWKQSLYHLIEKRLQAGPPTVAPVPSTVPESQTGGGSPQEHGTGVDLREELRLIITRVDKELETGSASLPVKKYVRKQIDEANLLLEDETTPNVQLRVSRDKLLGCEERIRFVNSGNRDSYINEIW